MSKFLVVRLKSLDKLNDGLNVLILLRMASTYPGDSCEHAYFDIMYKI